MRGDRQEPLITPVEAAGFEQPRAMQDSDDPRPLLKDDAKKSNNLSDADAPTDHGNHVYLTMMLLGVGSLFGWNIFINAVKYFQSQLVGSRWHAYVINYVTVAFQVGQAGLGKRAQG